jgi:hypothetical protein
MSEEINQYYICDNLTVNENLNYLYEQISNIHYEPTDLKNYFNEIFTKMTNYKNEKYLKNAECLSMYNFFNFLCDKLKMNKITSDNVNSIPNNSVVTLKIPAVPGTYHFITAVIYSNMVDIYQSYGGSRNLYCINNLPLTNFMTLLQDCKDLVTNKKYSYYTDMLKFKRISRVLSRIMDIECKALENNIISHNYDYSMDTDEDSDGIKNLMSLSYKNNKELTMQDQALGFCNDQAVAIIKKDYQDFITSGNEVFTINIYTPSLSGGKLKKNIRKQKGTNKRSKKRNTKKLYRS